MNNTYKIIRKRGDFFEENSFLCIQVESGCGLLIDPSTDAFLKNIEEQGLQVEAILLTHGHIDHIYKVDMYAKRYNIPVYIHEKEARKLQRPEENLSEQFTEPCIVETKPVLLKGTSGKLKLPNFTVFYDLRAGHSAGNLLFQIEGTTDYFIGDSVFKDSIGRYDLPDSNARAHHVSLQKMLEHADTDVFYPGHGEPFTKTDLAHNKVFNQFIRLGM